MHLGMLNSSVFALPIGACHRRATSHQLVVGIERVDCMHASRCDIDTGDVSLRDSPHALGS